MRLSSSVLSTMAGNYVPASGVRCWPLWVAGSLSWPLPDKWLPLLPQRSVSVGFWIFFTAATLGTCLPEPRAGYMGQRWSASPHFVWAICLFTLVKSNKKKLSIRSSKGWRKDGDPQVLDGLSVFQVLTERVCLGKWAGQEESEDAEQSGFQGLVDRGEAMRKSCVRSLASVRLLNKVSWCLGLSSNV